MYHISIIVTWCSCNTGLVWKIKWFCRQKLFLLKQFPTLCHSKGAGHVQYDHQRKKFEPFWKELSYSTRGMQAGLKKLFWAEEENSGQGKKRKSWESSSMLAFLQIAWCMTFLFVQVALWHFPCGTLFNQSWGRPPPRVLLSARGNEKPKWLQPSVWQMSKPSPCYNCKYTHENKYK